MSEATKKMRALFMYVLPLLAPLFIGFQPAAIQLSFFFASLLSFATVLLIRTPASRKYLNIAPIVKRAATNIVPTQYQGNMTVASRLATHPANIKASQAREGATKRGFTSMNFSALRNPISTVRESVSGFVGEVMPSARGDMKSKDAKKQKSRADDYEAKRAREIEAAKMKAEGKAQRKRR